jgi:PAS domain S-box-containing protein
MNARVEIAADVNALLVDVETVLASERKAKEARDYAEAVIESIPPFLVLDSDLRVLSANDSFCEHFHVAREGTENCLLYELGNGQWNIPELRAFLDKVLPRNIPFRNFEVIAEFKDLGRRTMLLSGRQVEHLQKILLFIDDVTEKLASQEALRISEIRYRRLFEAARDGILVLDPTTRRIQDANPFMSELLGYEHEDLLGKELWQIGLLKDEEASRAAFTELQKTGYIRYEDLPLETNTGVRREVEFVSNLYQENGHKVIQCNIRDITERKQADAASQLLSAIVESSDDAIASKDFNGVITSWNKGAERLFGYTAAEAIGKSVAILIPEERLDEEPGILEKIRSGQSLEHYETVRRRKDGTPVDISLTVSPIRNAEGKIVGASKIARDIGEKIQAREKLEQTVVERTAELRETIGELEAFSYSLSHDMRAPLRAMIGFSRILCEQHAEKLDAEGVCYLEKIAAAALRMDRLIQDVLTYTHVLRSELKFEATELNTLVPEIIATYPSLHPDRADVRIEGVLPSIRSSGPGLAQCISNLLANAVKFVAPGTRPRVIIRAEVIGPDIRLWIEDNGIGIEPKDQQRIFTMFERVNSASAYEGTGIGLAIVRKALERMGGTAGVQSEIGHGSKFWIQLKKGGPHATNDSAGGR